MRYTSHANDLMEQRGPAILARENALAISGRHLGVHRLDAFRASRSSLPKSTTATHWVEAHAVLTVTLAYSVALTEQNDAEQTDLDETLVLDGKTEREYDYEYCELDTGFVSDHLTYARYLPHVTSTHKNPLLNDDVWVFQTMRTLVENHWVALTVLSTVYLAYDPDETIVAGVLAITASSDYWYPQYQDTDPTGRAVVLGWDKEPNND